MGDILCQPLFGRNKRLYLLCHHVKIARQRRNLVVPFADLRSNARVEISGGETLRRRSQFGDRRRQIQRQGITHKARGNNNREYLQEKPAGEKRRCLKALELQDVDIDRFVFEFYLYCRISLVGKPEKY